MEFDEHDFSKVLYDDPQINDNVQLTDAPSSSISPLPTVSDGDEPHASPIIQLFPLNPFVEERSSVEHPSDESNQRQDTPVPINEKYRIHLGTRPGHYTDKDISFGQSQQLHQKQIDALDIFLSFFGKSTIQLKNAFSVSQWGLEPYTCLVFTLCPPVLAKGLTAIIGRAFQQDGIGLYADCDNNSSHRLFSVSRSCGLPIPDNDALEIMKIINKQYQALSAQFDENGLAVELHDFDNKLDQKTSVEDVYKILQGYFREDSYQVIETIGNSAYLGKAEYDEAIKQAELEYLAALIDMTRTSDTGYKPLQHSTAFFSVTCRCLCVLLRLFL